MGTRERKEERMGVRKRWVWGLVLGGTLVVAGLGLSGVMAEEPSDVPEGVPQRILDRLQERLDSGQAGPLFGVVHGDLSLTRFDGSQVDLRYDRGMIVERTADTVTLLRLDGERVTLAVDDRTVVREGLSDAAVDDLAVGDRAMFLSERLDDGTLHAVGIRCIDDRPIRRGTGPGDLEQQ